MNSVRIICLMRLFLSLTTWMIFLAIGLHVKEAFGAQKVVYTFLIQGIPPFLFSTILSKKISVNHEKQTFFVLQIIVGIFALGLIFFNSLIYIYFYLLISSLISTITNPLFTTLASKSVTDKEWTSLHTKISSISTSVMVFAPMAGGSLATYLGINILFVLVAIFLFLTGGLVLNLEIVKEELSQENLEESHEHFLKLWMRKFLYFPTDLKLKSEIIKWCNFLILGALVNSIEFFVFERLSFSRSEIGIAVSCWGVGGLIAFLLSYKKIVLNISSKILAILYTFSLLVFSIAPNFSIVCFSFLLAGSLQSLLAGSLRNNISSAIPTGERSIVVWASTNQWMGLINIVIYSLGAFFIPLVNPYVIGISILIFGSVGMVSNLSLRSLKNMFT